MVGVVALVAVAVIGSALVGPWSPDVAEESRLPFTPPPVSIEPIPGPTDDLRGVLDQIEVEPWDLTWLRVAVLAVLLAWAAWVVVRWLRRHPPVPRPEDPDDAGIESGEARTGRVEPRLAPLREAVAAADVLIRRRRTPTDAVIAAWVRLEDAAARTGVPRDPAATATEFTVAVLDRTPVDPAATRTLLDLYLRARFSGERMAPEDVDAAVAALARLADGLHDPDLLAEDP